MTRDILINFVLEEPSTPGFEIAEDSKAYPFTIEEDSNFTSEDFEITITMA